jgi:hypothetical protein
MDTKNLAIKFQNFNHVCQNKGYIISDISFELVCPNIKPAIFNIEITANKKWIQSLNIYRQAKYMQALDSLIHVFWQTTTVKIRKNIYLLIINNSGQKGNPKLYVINPDLHAKQIKNLFYSTNYIAKRKILKFLKTGRLNKQQIVGLLNINDEKIITLLKERYSNDKSFENLVCSSRGLKFKFLGLRI